ncbi:MAG: methyltransferase domain-containing protein [Isosphaeraceae bacterium]
MNSIERSTGGDTLVKQSEEHFHDEWAATLEPAEVMVDESWEAATCPEHRWIKDQLRDLRGRRVLDLGCGAGEAAVWIAKQGAEVVASDISSHFLDRLRVLLVLLALDFRPLFPDRARAPVAAAVLEEDRPRARPPRASVQSAQRAGSPGTGRAPVLEALLLERRGVRHQADAMKGD